MRAVLEIVMMVLELYSWVIIGAAVLSWLTAFNVINMRNRFVYMLNETCYRLTEPVMRPIRRVLPYMGGLDLSPIIILLGITFGADIDKVLVFIF
jgi:YggT family protein